VEETLSREFPNGLVGLASVDALAAPPPTPSSSSAAAAGGGLDVNGGSAAAAAAAGSEEGRAAPPPPPSSTAISAGVGGSSGGRQAAAAAHPPPVYLPEWASSGFFHDTIVSIQDLRAYIESLDDRLVGLKARLGVLDVAYAQLVDVLKLPDATEDISNKHLEALEKQKYDWNSKRHEDLALLQSYFIVMEDTIGANLCVCI
jgi:hypothetical protein